MIRRLEARHRGDDLAAARNWMGLFAGEQDYGAMIAAKRWHVMVESVIAIVRAIGKGR